MYVLGHLMWPHSAHSSTWGCTTMGLVHVSALANKYVSDPHDIVRSGQVVKVKVMEC